MNELHAFLATVWFILLGLIIALYVLLDGVELGVGIVSLRAQATLENGIPAIARRTGRFNEIWLLLAGGVLFGAFPLAFTLIGQQLYLPVALLLAGLVMRRAGILYSRHNGKPGLALYLYGWGSVLAAAMQGLLLGAVWNSLTPIPDALGSLLPSWLTPTPLAISAAAVLAYSLLGICYLHGRRPLLRSGLLLLLLTLGALALGLYPDIIPGQLTLNDAAASNQRLLFMILGISLLLPVILAYNGFQYVLFSKRSRE